MLLATALCSVLLATLWMLMGTYGELFDKGQRQVERAQLGRALLQQMADDLRTAIQDPIPGSPGEASGAAQRRRFGLFGSSQELRFDVLQPTPLQAKPTPFGQSTGSTAEQSAPRVPELRTVHYSFSRANASGDLADDRLRGLVRRELDFETPLESESPQPDAVSSLEEAPNNRDSESAMDDTSLWVPEVVSLQLSYFDGQAWTGSWNSLERKSLPAAVEIQVQLTDHPQAARAGSTQPTPRDSIEETAEFAPADDLANAGSEAPVPSLPPATYRLIVDLPGSPNYRKPAVKEEPTLRQPARPPAPARRIAPPRFTRPAAPPPLPEDWIRTDSR
jgi:hypothetical protein